MDLIAFVGLDAVLCVEPPTGAPDARTIAGRVLASGRAWVAVAKYEGRDVIRICLTHGEATMEDIGELADALMEACVSDSLPNDNAAAHR